MTSDIDLNNGGTIDKKEMTIFVLELFQANRNIQFKKSEDSPLLRQEGNDGQEKKDLIWQAYRNNVDKKIPEW